MPITNTAGFYGLQFNWAGFALSVIIVILVFLLVREIMLWYWKVNEIVELLKDIKANTSKDKNETRSQP